MRRVMKIGVPAVLALSVVMAGCSNSKETVKEMDPPQINYIEDEGELNEDVGSEMVDEQGVMDTVKREIYLIDEDGMVVPQVFDVPKTESVLRQSLEYLVDGGPISNLLPNGFRAVLPAGTEIDVHLKEDGTAIADFSEEFRNYSPQSELQILQSITWTLTQFDNVDKVQIRINGYDQETMPVNHTPIGNGYSRANGINLESNDVVDLVNSKPVTLYFLAQNMDNMYYVPVTRRVNNSEEHYSEVVNQLIKGPSIYSNLLTDFRDGVALLDEPKYENGVVTLNFNEAILNQLQGTAISNEVLNVLVLSLTEQQGVEKVAIEVNGDAEVLKASGEVLAEPVTRPALVSTGKF